MLISVKKLTCLYLFIAMCLLPHLSNSNEVVPIPPLPQNDETEKPVEPVEPVEPVSAIDGAKSAAEKDALKSTADEMRLIKGVDNTLLNNSVRFVNYLLKANRNDQDAVHQFARKINRNLDNCLNCEKLPAQIREFNKDLITKSYVDSLLQNGNLSNQLATRLGGLVSDSLLLTTQDNPSLRADFLYEYELIARRYENSRRFRVGLGIDNSYLPRFRHNTRTSLDFSAYQSEIGTGRERLDFLESFANNVSTTLLLSADTPILKLNATFPNLVKTEETTLPVESRDIVDSDTKLLYRTKIDTSLEVDYDVGAVIEINTIADFGGKLLSAVGFPSSSKDKESKESVPGYFGVGFGATGIKITENISNEIKFTTPDTSVFNELPIDSTDNKRITNSDLIPYFSLSYVFEVSDEFKASFEARRYYNSKRPIVDTSDNDYSFSLQAVWYPTFNFKFPW